MTKKELAIAIICIYEKTTKDDVEAQLNSGEKSMKRLFWHMTTGVCGTKDALQRQYDELKKQAA